MCSFCLILCLVLQVMVCTATGRSSLCASWLAYGTCTAKYKDLSISSTSPKPSSLHWPIRWGHADKVGGLFDRRLLENLGLWIWNIWKTRTISSCWFMSLSNLFSSPPQETHQKLAEKKKLHVVEFQSQKGPLPKLMASPKDGARPVGEPEDDIPDTPLHWDEVRAAQGIKRSVWASVKRSVW